MAETGVHAVFDIEITNRCNARCIMCPRDKVPELGSMDQRTFRRVVGRVKEYGKVDALVLGGLGEPTVHKELVEFVRIAADASLAPSIITNGMLLTREMSKALVDAGLRNIDLSIGGFRKETYERVQVGCKFEKVYRNGLDFIDVAGRKAFLNIQISPTDLTYPEAEDIAAFWRANGARFCFVFPFAASRGGALKGNAEGTAARLASVPVGCINIEEVFRPSRSDYKDMHRRSSYVCYAKDRFVFVAWRGTYQLCCNDYEKKHCIGDVFTMSVEDAFRRKAEASPETNALCETCRMSNRDLAARDLKSYLTWGGYLLESAVSRLCARKELPGLGPPG